MYFTYDDSRRDDGAQYPKKGNVAVGNENMGYCKKKRGQTSTWPSGRFTDGDCVMTCTELKVLLG
jgi:hypothetical protein